MIDIKEAIEQSKLKDNVSNGGSACYDFGDVVLVKYVCPTKYLYNGERTRDNSEIVMQGVNELADKGVNTPRHIAVERVIENGNDICYVLQEKSKGINCASMAKYGVSYEEMKESLEFVLNIPFEHYKKLVSDCYEVFDLAHEPKSKNLFYDKDTGFWLIDFLENNKNNKYSKDNILKLFYTIKYKVPNLLNIVSSISYNQEITQEQLKEQTQLEYAIYAKLFLAIKDFVPEFNKYEKFYLCDQLDEYKRYLMEKGIVTSDLFSLSEEDYIVFDYLYEKVITGIIENIYLRKDSYANIEVNTIRNDSSIFNLAKMWIMHKDNPVDKNLDEDDLRYESEKSFTHKMLEDIKNRLENMEKNENTIAFLNDMNASLISKNAR